MAKNTDIKLFQDRQVRSVWDESQEQWLFSIVDVVAILTDSADPKQYIKKMRSRDQELNVRWGTICTPTKMQAADGNVAKVAREELESKTGRPVVSALNARKFFEKQSTTNLEEDDKEK